MNRTKSFLKIWVLALALLFAVALAFAVTGAAYNASRKADGSLSMANGIVIDYSGFGKAQDGEWQKEQTTTFKLFTDRAIVPGDTVSLNSAAIKKGTDSIDFYARIKFEYKFYDALDADITTTVGNEYTNFISTPAFNSAWVNGNNNDGWFYYATGTTLNTLPTSFVNIFSSSAINVELNVAGFNHEGGGYKFTDTNSNEITIAKVEAILTLEAVQTTGSTWEINPLVQNSSSQVVEIYSNQITLGNVGGAYKLGTGEAGSLAYNTANLGTTLKIVVAGDSQINANAFNGSDLEEVYIGDQDYINGVSSYAAKIYSTPATITIGANAFSSASLNLYLSSSCNYNIYVSSLAGVGNVYYDGVLRNDLKSPSVGAVANTTITVLETPSIVTGGSGSVIISPESYGDYIYTDAAQGLKWYFSLINNGASAELKKCQTSLDVDPTGSISIPSIVSSSELAGSISVTSIWVFAFSGCSGLTSITIPNSVTSIGSEAFSGCTGLTSFSGGNSKYQVLDGGRCLVKVDKNNQKLIAFAPSGLTTYTISNSVTSIGANVFEGFSGLTSITIPNSVTSIDGNAFEGCSGLTSITIPDSVTSIGGNAFEGCSGLTSITIPDSVTSIGNYAFSGCSSLTSFSGGNSKYQVIGNGRCLVEVDGNNQTLRAFAPSGLTTYTIPNSVTSIGGRVFEGFSGLTSITIPDSVTSIGITAFYYCTGLTSIIIPDSVTYIGPSAFESCSNLISITIPDSVTSIDRMAFSSCSGLTSITIPNSVTSIGSGAFQWCTGLTSVAFEGPGRTENLDIESYAFYFCSDLATVNFDNWPNGVTVTIGEGAFSGCPVEGNVQLPSQS